MHSHPRLTRADAPLISKRVKGFLYQKGLKDSFIKGSFIKILITAPLAHNFYKEPLVNCFFVQSVQHCSPLIGKGGRDVYMCSSNFEARNGTPQLNPPTPAVAVPLRMCGYRYTFSNLI